MHFHIHNPITEESADENEARARARSTFGKYRDTATDVSEEHDRYLPETFSV